MLVSVEDWLTSLLEGIGVSYSESSDSSPSSREEDCEESLESELEEADEDESEEPRLILDRGFMAPYCNASKNGKKTQ